MPYPFGYTPFRMSGAGDVKTKKAVVTLSLTNGSRVTLTQLANRFFTTRDFPCFLKSKTSFIWAPAVAGR